MTAPELPEGLVRYLAERDQQRVEDVDQTLMAMTERERWLVTEVAVMAYVRGGMAERAGEREAPPNTTILAGVVDACLAMPDLYPTINRMRRLGARRAGVR